MPDPDCERPSYMKRRARQLLFEAARLADASTLGEGQRDEGKGRGKGARKGRKGKGKR